MKTIEAILLIVFLAFFSLSQSNIEMVGYPNMNPDGDTIIFEDNDGRTIQIEKAPNDKLEGGDTDGTSEPSRSDSDS